MSRVAISIGKLNIYWYSIFVLLGMLLGIFLVLKESKKHIKDKGTQKKIDSIIETIRIRKFENPQLAPVYEGDINWLKSLRPQSTWKPSDEQIEILDMVLSNESMDDNVANILRKLREQLKKLREE